MSEEQVTQQLAEILSRLSKLPSQNLEPPQFFANYLQLSVAATGGDGGALWLVQQGQMPKCYCHIEIELSGINSSEGQRKVLTQALQQSIVNNKYQIVPANGVDPSTLSYFGEAADIVGGNETGRAIYFRPLRAANQAAMVLQVISREELDPSQYRMVLALLEQIGETGETYLAHRRAAVLEDDRKTLAKLLQYTEGVHESLDAETVVYQMANCGRDAIGCSRVVVWVDPDVKRGLRAVSGVDKPDHRAILMQSIEKLCRQCLEIKKPILATRDQLKELPDEEELTHLLRDYFNVSQLNQIYLQPFEGKDKHLIGVIAAEGFEQEATANLAGVASQAARHGSLALQHALEAGSATLVNRLTKLRAATSSPEKKRKLKIWVTAAVVFLILCSLIPWTIRINCQCELTPWSTRVIDSPLDSAQVSKVLIASGAVKKGDVIATLDDTELKAQKATIEADKRKAEVELKQEIRSVERKSIELQIERLQSQIDLVQWQIDQCQVRSPIDGVIMTPQLETREGVTLKRGDSFCEIADLSQWELLLNVPDEEIGWVQRGLSEQKDGAGADVLFFLAAYPEYKLEARVKDVSQISYMSRVKEGENIFEVRVEVPGEQLVKIQSGLRSGSTGRAKIDTCSRPLVYVLLRKVIRFCRVTFF